MTQNDVLITCVNCTRPIREADAEEAGWRYWSDGIDLHLICSLCAHSKFRSDAQR